MNPQRFSQPLHRERIVDSQTRKVVYSAGPDSHDAGTASADGFRTSAEDLIPEVKAALRKRGFYVLGAHELELIWHDVSSGPAREQLLRAFALRAEGELQPGWTRSTALLRVGPPTLLES